MVQRVALPLRLSIMGTAWVQGALLSQAVIRGLDYAAGDKGRATSPLLSIVERTLPLPLWGAGFLVGAVLAVAGMLLVRPGLVIAGHTAIAAVYAAIGVGQLLVAAENLPMDWTTPRPVPVAAGFVAAAVLAWRVDAPWWARTAWAAAGYFVVGGAVTLAVVGDGIRTSTGLLVATAAHVILALAAHRLDRVEHLSERGPDD